jgi:hypothetical protein
MFEVIRHPSSVETAASTNNGQRMTDDVGLCLTCRWVRAVTNRRGSTFFRCRRADTDPRFPRYPALPMLQCVGYEERQPDHDPGRGERGEAG